jgi:hypothetical protein
MTAKTAFKPLPLDDVTDYTLTAPLTLNPDDSVSGNKFYP